METKKIVRYDLVARYLYGKYLSNVFECYKKIEINPTLIFCEIVEIFGQFEKHKRTNKIFRFDTVYSRDHYNATKFNLSWIFDKSEKDITSKTITVDHIRRILSFIIFYDNFQMVYKLENELSEFVIYKYDLCKAFINLNFVNKQSEDSKIFLSYIKKIENDLTLQSGDINVYLIQENEILKQKNKMLTQLILNNTKTVNTQTKEDIDYYKRENEKLKELLKTIYKINSRYVTMLNVNIEEKLK